MKPITPHDYLKDLKELLNIELDKIAKQKNTTIQLQQFEMATLYSDIEKKLNAFLITL
ncbi:MAG: hypothetical protein V4722_08410 [Bacteroidota bacterium]